MRFGKIKPKYDGKKLGKNIYAVADELFTEREMVKYNVPIHYVDLVEINRNDTFWFFGCRFAK